jgi:adenylosuccinate lyase
VNSERLAEELNQHWEVLAEPVQMILRKHGYDQPYELLKKLTRGKTSLTEEEFKTMRESLIRELELIPAIADELRVLRPEKYVGIAPSLAMLADAL